MNNIREQLSKVNAYKLYHSEVYMPDKLTNEVGKLMKSKRFVFAKHIKYGVNRDEKHTIKLNDINEAIKRMKRDKIKPFEIETQFGTITKFCIKLDDVCIAFAPMDGWVLVKTCWICKDSHNTLDISRYEKGE